MWQRAAKRDVLFKVDRFGNLYITCLGDGPRDPRLYSYDAPAMPAWAAPGLASDMPEDVAQAALPAEPPCHTPRPDSAHVLAPAWLDTS